jgi:hypothetical protein
MIRKSLSAALLVTCVASALPATSFAGVMPLIDKADLSPSAQTTEVHWRSYAHRHHRWHMGWHYGWHRHGMYAGWHPRYARVYGSGVYAAAAPIYGGGCGTYGAAYPAYGGCGTYGAAYPTCGGCGAYGYGGYGGFGGGLFGLGFGGGLFGLGLGPL